MFRCSPTRFDYCWVLVDADISNAIEYRRLKISELVGRMVIFGHRRPVADSSGKTECFELLKAFVKGT